MKWCTGVWAACLWVSSADRWFYWGNPALLQVLMSEIVPIYAADRQDVKISSCWTTSRKMESFCVSGSSFLSEEKQDRESPAGHSVLQSQVFKKVLSRASRLLEVFLNPRRGLVILAACSRLVSVDPTGAELCSQHAFVVPFWLTALVLSEACSVTADDGSAGDDVSVCDSLFDGSACLLCLSTCEGFIWLAVHVSRLRVDWFPPNASVEEKNTRCIKRLCDVTSTAFQKMHKTHSYT